MIQRIQTIYLFIVTVLLVIAMCLPVGAFINGEGVISKFTNLGVQLPAGADSSPWGMFAILLLSAIISFATIFLYKNRMLQIRMTIFNIILMIGYYITYIAFIFILKEKFESTFQIAWGACLPLISIILSYLAIRAIGKDEFLVKAADRLR